MSACKGYKSRRKTSASPMGNSVSPASSKGLKRSSSSASDSAKSSAKGLRARTKARFVSRHSGSRASSSSAKGKTSKDKTDKIQCTPVTDTMDGLLFDISPSAKRREALPQPERKRSRTSILGEDSLDGGLETAMEASAGIVGIEHCLAPSSPSGHFAYSPGTRKRRLSSKSRTASPEKVKRHRHFAAKRKSEEKGQGAGLVTEREH